MTVPVVTAAVVYDCEYTGKTYILVIYNALYLQNMDTNLVPPIVMRLEGLDVYEFPKFLSSKPTESNNYVYCRGATASAGGDTRARENQRAHKKHKKTLT